MGEVLYILSDNRSGSTLLDQLLGAHDEIVSLGEVHHLRAYALNDRKLYDPAHALACSCGMVLNDCAFWRSVESRLTVPLGSLAVDLRHLGWSDDVRQNIRGLAQFFRRLVELYPLAYRSARVRRIFDSNRTAVHSFLLYDAIFQETMARYLVDSSKSAYRFRTLYEYRPEKIRTIILTRDYRGTVHSKMKRGRAMKPSARSWAACMRRIAVMTADVPTEKKLRVKYEDLCADPRRELGRICEWLNLGFSEYLLSRPSEGLHHIGGSPSKLDPNKKTIALDTAYLGAFTTEELAAMRKIVGRSARDWGYD